MRALWIWLREGQNFSYSVRQLVNLRPGIRTKGGLLLTMGASMDCRERVVSSLGRRSLIYTDMEVEENMNHCRDFLKFSMAGSHRRRL